MPAGLAKDRHSAAYRDDVISTPSTPGRVGDRSSKAPRRPPLIEPDMTFSIIRLSDGVHVVADAVRHDGPSR
jgi:hypothetical protein